MRLSIHLQVASEGAIKDAASSLAGDHQRSDISRELLRAAVLHHLSEVGFEKVAEALVRYGDELAQACDADPHYRGPGIRRGDPEGRP